MLALDGDTAALGPERIRFQGYNTPELTTPALQPRLPTKKGLVQC